MINVSQFSYSVMSNSLQPQWTEAHHTPRACSNSCPLSQWCHPTSSSSVIPFSYLQSFPSSGSFPVSQLFPSCSQSIGNSASASVLLMNIQNWFPLGLTGLISLQSRGVSRVFSSTIWKHHFLVLSLLYGPTLTSVHTSGKTIALMRWTFLFKIGKL